MATTLADLQTRLAYRLAEDSSPAITEKEYIRRTSFLNEGQRKALGEHYWWFLQEQKSTTSVASQEIYSLASDYRDMIELRLDGKVVVSFPQHDAFGSYNYPPLYYQYRSVLNKYYIFGDTELHILPIPSSAPSAVSISSITRSSTTATVTTSTAHGYSNYDWVTIAGAGQTEYNGEQQILSVPSTTTFTFTVDGDATTPATGTMTTTERNIVYRYWKTTTDLSSGTDVIVIPDRYSDILVAYAMGRKMSTVEDMARTGAEGFEEFNLLLKDMTAEDNRKKLYNKSVLPLSTAKIVE